MPEAATPRVDDANDGEVLAVNRRRVKRRLLFVSFGGAACIAGLFNRNIVWLFNFVWFAVTAALMLIAARDVIFFALGPSPKVRRLLLAWAIAVSALVTFGFAMIYIWKCMWAEA